MTRSRSGVGRKGDKAESSRGKEKQSYRMLATCRKQQPDSMDCGVHVLWWSEAYLQDTHEFWAKEMTEHIACYRMQVVLHVMYDPQFSPGYGSPTGSPPRHTSPHMTVPALPPPAASPADTPAAPDANESPIPVAEVPVPAAPLQAIPPGGSNGYDDDVVDEAM